MARDLKKEIKSKLQDNIMQDALSRFADQYPGARLWFIMGADSLLSLEDWYKGKDLLREYDFVLAPRQWCQG